MKVVRVSGSKKWLVLGSLALIATITCFLLLRTSRPQRIWRAGYFPFPPYMLEKPDGGPDGFVIQLVEEAARARNIHLQWVFAKVRDQAYPPEVLKTFDSLGIDFRKESEVHYYGRTPAGLHTYRGWFYLVGSIEQGPDSWFHPPSGKPERRFHRIGPHFEVGLGRKSGYGFSEWESVLIAAGFADGPCVEVDFYADLPWLSDAPEPVQSQ